MLKPLHILQQGLCSNPSISYNKVYVQTPPYRTIHVNCSYSPMSSKSFNVYLQVCLNIHLGRSVSRKTDLPEVLQRGLCIEDRGQTLTRFRNPCREVDRIVKIRSACSQSERALCKAFRTAKKKSLILYSFVQL